MRALLRSLALAALSLTGAASLAQAAPPEALLVLILPPGGVRDAKEEADLERLRASLISSISPAPQARLGLQPAPPAPAVAPILRQIADGEDAWYRSAFDEAEERLRDALAWALERPRTAAANPALARALHRTARFALALDRMHGREPEQDRVVCEALAWWGDVPLAEDEFPPDLVAASESLRAAPDRCTGELRWELAGPLPEGWRLDVGGRRLPLDATVARDLPCGTWPLALAPPGGHAPVWVRPVPIGPDPHPPVRLTPSLEAHVRVWSARALEVEDHVGLGEGLAAWADGAPLRIIAVDLSANQGLRTRELRLEESGVLVPLLDKDPAGIEIATDASPSHEGPSLHDWGPWALYGLAAASLAAGVALHVQTNSWIADQNAGQSRLLGRIEAGRAGAWAGYGLSASAALGGAIWQIVER